jgi:type IV secretion system protein VirD4
MTLAQKIEPILSRRVLRQMIPKPGVVEFDAAVFVQSRDTLVLLTDDNATTNVAPLTTMLLDDVVNAAKRVAARSMTGRLDPILRIVGDEISNVAPLPKLPKLLSDSRGIGIQWFAIFQSVAQMISRWGEDGADQIAANLNASFVLGGLQDVKALERFSALVGSDDLQQVSTTLGDDHSATSHNVSLAERRLLRPEQIRQLPDNKALMIYRNAPAMIVDLMPWTERPDADSIEAGIEHIRRIRTATHG